MKDNFFISPQNSHRRHEIFVQSRKTAKYAAKVSTLMELTARKN